MTRIEWPAASERQIEVPNRRFRLWMQPEQQTIMVTQTLPAKIANQPIPVISGHSPDDLSAALAQASDSVAQLEARVIDARFQNLGALTTLMLRGEAVASSQIEHIHTTHEALAIALADLDETGDAIVPRDLAPTWLVSGAVESVELAFERRGFDQTCLKRLHATLLAGDLEIEKRHLGQWRDCAVWIGPNRSEAVFEAPPHELVPELIDDLVMFCTRTEINPIVKAAVAHAQFEIIHPFVDGNGRVGRALIHSLISSSAIPVPVAQGLLKAVSLYIHGLNAYQKGDLGTWLSIFASAVVQGCAAAEKLVGSLVALQQHYETLIPNARAGSVKSKLLRDVIVEPVVTSLMLQRRYGISGARASQICHELRDLGVLRESNVWAPTRQKVWVATDVLELLDHFGEQLPRSVRDPRN